MKSRCSVSDTVEWALDGFREVLTLTGDTARLREAWFLAKGLLDRLAFEIGQRVIDGEPLSAIAGEPAVSELRGVMRQSHLAQRMLAWPRGYPGDFETIDGFYRGRERGTTPVGQLVDRWIRQQEGPRALLRRPANVARIISQAAERSGSGAPRVLVIASGPAAEVFEYLSMAPGARAQFTCLDIDEDAHALVRARAAERRLSDRIVTVRCNALRVAAGKESLDLPPQDLAYSIGLNDYLEDAHSVLLLNWMHRTLAPGGVAVVGNLTRGTEAEFAASVLNWPLRYRDAPDMERLFARSAFAATSGHWTDDATGCQMYDSGCR